MKNLGNPLFHCLRFQKEPRGALSHLSRKQEIVTVELWNRYKWNRYSLNALDFANPYSER